MGGLHSNLAIVEYVGRFPGLSSHGNSREQTEYIRTPSHVFDDIAEMTDKYKPHQIYNKLKDKYDDLVRPNNMQQIYDKQKYDRSKTAQFNGHSVTNNIADQIVYLENLVTDSHPFVRSVVRTSGKTPFVILYTDEQLTDLRNLCCTGQTILGVDKTFMLCKMHVTVTCFKHLTVKRQRTDEPPLFLGPMFLHDSSDFETYSHFFHHLRMKLMGTQLDKLVIGSDDEQALVKAICTEFPDSTHVLCTRHLQENARQILTDSGVSLNERKVILNKIFSADGLVNETDGILFELKCTDIEKYCEEKSVKFLTYFQRRLKGHIEVKVNIPLRRGMVDRSWTNNNCESVNHTLKQTVDWKTKSLPELVKLIENLVAGQYKELRGALVGIGDFRLADTHVQFKSTKTAWLTMNDVQRTNLYRRFRRHVARDDKYVVSSDGAATVVAPKTNGKKPGQRKRTANVRTTTVHGKKPKL